MDTPDGSTAQTFNPWQMAQTQLANVAEKLDLDPGIYEVLSHCRRELTVSMP